MILDDAGPREIITRAADHVFAQRPPYPAFRYPDGLDAALWWAEWMSSCAWPVDTHEPIQIAARSALLDAARRHGHPISNFEITDGEDLDGALTAGRDCQGKVWAEPLDLLSRDLLGQFLRETAAWVGATDAPGLSFPLRAGYQVARHLLGLGVDAFPANGSPS